MSTLCFFVFCLDLLLLHNSGLRIGLDHPQGFEVGEGNQDRGKEGAIRCQ